MHNIDLLTRTDVLDIARRQLRHKSKIREEKIDSVAAEISCCSGCAECWNIAQLALDQAEMEVSTGTMKRTTEAGYASNGFRERGEPWIPCTCGHPMDGDSTHKGEGYLYCRLCGIQWALEQATPADPW